LLNYRRNLPHLHTEGIAIFLNWRLWGSVAKCKREDLLKSNPTAGHAFVVEDRELDRKKSGPKWLADERVAQMVADKLMYGTTQRAFYDLHAWVLMPNHVHLLLTPQVPLPKITRWLKGATAREANQILHRTGQPFWKDESWDRWVRDGSEFSKTKHYIEHNPVSAGLVTAPELFRFSSAWTGGSACPTLSH
jgi:REP element-mobilizing transposase RayT